MKRGCTEVSALLMVMAVLTLITSMPVMVCALAGNACAEESPYAGWKYGPSPDPDFFPIGVWLQAPHRASRYKAAGFNLYIGLWKGPTEEQLEALRNADMRVICSQNDVGLKYREDPIIAGWMHQDEPDNAQSDGSGGYGPPVLPDSIIAGYHRMKDADPDRPVYLNLGQGVAWDNYIGRGVRRNHPEDYPEYIKGSDIVSFDIYPVNSTYPETKDNIWYVPLGVDRLHGWAEGRAVVWNFVECTSIRGTGTPTPEQVRSEVWMSIVHGSRGILYFVHRIDPFLEYALLEDPVMLEAVTAINLQIHDLAPVLNSPTITGPGVVSSNDAVPVDIMAKRHGGYLYLFATAMRPGETRATFTIGSDLDAEVVVVGEDRTVSVADGVFADDFPVYGVHIYRIDDPGTSVGETRPDGGLALRGNYPNPFNPSTVISFSLDSMSEGSVVVYDTAGRRVRDLARGTFSPGVNAVTWDGTDGSGNNAASGVYLYAVTAGGRSVFGRMLLVR